jgi:hypothetical protein
MAKAATWYVKQWRKRYNGQDIPDQEPDELWGKVPSYRRVALSILTNNPQLLGVKPKTSVFYHMIKREEIGKRVYNGKQLQLKFDYNARRMAEDSVNIDDREQTENSERPSRNEGEDRKKPSRHGRR